MKSRKVNPGNEKSIPGIADEMARTAVKSLCKDGKLTPQGQRLAKLLDRVLPDEKVDEWGWNLSRRERAAIKRRAAEKRAADEARRAEARARAAYRRRLKALENGGEIDGHIQMKWAFLETFRELKRRGFSIRRMNAMRRSVEARISERDRLCHRDYLEYFVYDYYRECGNLFVELFPKEKKAKARRMWAHALEPFKRPEPWFCPA
ncbi:MAG: hypothetical protein ACI4UY_12180 [Kiritimatiellia bacterium]